MKLRWLSLLWLAAPVLAGDALTPQTLAELVSCTSFERYQALQPALLDVVFDKGPDWIRKNTAASQLGVYVYDLTTPITVFGQPVRRLALHKEFVSVPLADGETLAAAAKRLSLKRAPIAVTEQYYRFTGEAGPMLSAYEIAANPLALLLGVPDKTPAQRYLGCTYQPTDEATFLQVARQADAMMQQARHDMDRMMRDEPSPTKD